DPAIPGHHRRPPRPGPPPRPAPGKPPVNAGLPPFRRRRRGGPLVSLPFAAGEGRAACLPPFRRRRRGGPGRGAFHTPPPTKHTPLPTSPLCAPRPKGRVVRCRPTPS